jgi:AGZA family xanthine/uracil permease-like MFS transporter
LSFVGLIHGVKVEWNANGQISLGYLFAGLIFLAFFFYRPAEAESGADLPMEETVAV